MRHAIRIQPYVPRDLFQKLRAYAEARSLTVTAVINAALADYLERDEVEDALIVRRLDDVTSRSGRPPRATRSATRWRAPSRRGCSGYWREGNSPPESGPIVPQSFPRRPFQPKLKKNRSTFVELNGIEPSAS